MNVSKMLKTVKKATKKHAPKVLLALGIGLGGYAAYRAVKATPEALDILDEELNKRRPGSAVIPIQKIPEQFKLKDKVALTWRCYVPAVAAGAASVGCLVGAGIIDNKRISALTAAVSMSETALRDYMNAAAKTVGEKKEREIHDALAKDKLERSSFQEKRVIPTGNGETLCYDALSDRYFRSSVEAIRRAMNDVNKRIINGEDSATLNDLYFAMGLDTIGLGDNIGWNVERNVIDLNFSSQLVPSTGEPCLVVDHNEYPYALY